MHIIASNLRQGGAVQVAASLISELARTTDPSEFVLSAEASPEVARNIDAELHSLMNFSVVKRRPTSLCLWWSDWRRRSEFTIVVFGPAWFPVRGKHKVSGYADVTAIYAEPRSIVGRCGSARRRVRSWASKAQLHRFDHVVVETEAVRRVLIEEVRGAPRLHVVPNCVSAQALAGNLPVDVPLAPPGVVSFLYTTAYYPHKNIEFLAELETTLADRGVTARFLLTLDADAWQNLPCTLRRASHNVGPVPLEQLRALHQKADAVIFPSLLEAFSATPVEAMAFGTPLFVSDRDFTRSICGASATYFDPLDAASAAASIADALQDGDQLARKVEVGKMMYARMPTPEERARRILAICRGAGGAS